MAQFKRNTSLNVGQDFLNRFISFSSETRNRRPSKCLASTSLSETKSYTD